MTMTQHGQRVRIGDLTVGDCYAYPRKDLLEPEPPVLRVLTIERVGSNLVHLRSRTPDGGTLVRVVLRSVEVEFRGTE